MHSVVHTPHTDYDSAGSTVGTAVAIVCIAVVGDADVAVAAAAAVLVVTALHCQLGLEDSRQTSGTCNHHHAPYYY